MAVIPHVDGLALLTLDNHAEQASCRKLRHLALHTDVGLAVERIHLGVDQHRRRHSAVVDSEGFPHIVTLGVGAYLPGLGDDITLQGVDHTDFHLYVRAVLAPDVKVMEVVGGVGRLGEHRLELTVGGSECLTGVKTLETFVATRAHYDAPRASDLVNELVKGGGSVVGADMVAEAHVDNARLAHTVGIIEDVFYAVGDGHAVLLVKAYKDNLRAGSHAVILRQEITSGGCTQGVASVKLCQGVILGLADLVRVGIFDSIPETFWRGAE